MRDRICQSVIFHEKHRPPMGDAIVGKIWQHNGGKCTGWVHPGNDIKAKPIKVELITSGLWQQA